MAEAKNAALFCLSVSKKKYSLCHPPLRFPSSSSYQFAIHKDSPLTRKIEISLIWLRSSLNLGLSNICESIFRLFYTWRREKNTKQDNWQEAIIRMRVPTCSFLKSIGIWSIPSVRSWDLGDTCSSCWKLNWRHKGLDQGSLRKQF